MIQDFTYKQTTMADVKYNAKTLLGNWFEERCDPSLENNRFYSENKFKTENQVNAIITEQRFFNTSDDWLQYQQKADGNKATLYETQTQLEYKKPQEQNRNSVIDPCLTKPAYFDKKQQELEEYRKKWTQRNQVFDKTYLGSEKVNNFTKK